MRQASRTVAIALASVVFVAGQALAFQCPKLIKQIDDETALRFDPAAADAKVKLSRRPSSTPREITPGRKQLPRKD
jgi:hypothetical protein